MNKQNILFELEKEFSIYNGQLNDSIKEAKLNRIPLFIKLNKIDELKKELMMTIATQPHLKLSPAFFENIQKMYQVSIGNFSNVKSLVQDQEIELKPVSELVATDIENSSIVWSIHKSFRGVGRCFICGRELTDQRSIDRGIGPICFERVGGFNPLSQEEKQLSGWVDANYRLFQKRRSRVSSYKVLKETEKGIFIQVNFENGEFFQKWGAKRNMVYYNQNLFVKNNFAGLSFIR